MHKMDLEKAEEPETELPIAIGSQKKQRNYRKISTSVSLTMLTPLTVWITTNWKILKEVRIPDHLSCLLKHLYVAQEATGRILHGTTDWFKTEKGVRKSYTISLCSFNLYAEYIM